MCSFDLPNPKPQTPNPKPQTPNPISNSNLNYNTHPTMSMISEGLYIGSFADAKSKKFLTANKITHILSAAWELKPAFPDSYTYKQVKMSDKVDFDLTSHLEEAVSFIDSTINGRGRVLVHCYAGISRSVSCVIGYLVKHRSMCVADALMLIKAGRPQAMPNKGFIIKLEAYSVACRGDGLSNVDRESVLAGPSKVIAVGICKDNEERFRKDGVNRKPTMHMRFGS